MMRFTVFVFTVSTSLLLMSCSTLRTTYRTPRGDLPVTYAHADEQAKASLIRWWRRFGDPHLDALISEAMKNNSDLALAVLNIRAAQLQRHLVVINPTVSAGYGYDYSKSLSGASKATITHSLTASVAYQLDLWDQLGSLKDAARWEVRATELDRESAALLLIGNVVDLYYQIAALNQYIRLGQQDVAYAQKTMDLVKVQMTAGAASRLELTEAEQNLQSQEGSQAELIEQRVEARNALAVLLNGRPWPESEERSTVPVDPPQPIAAGQPVALLGRRPDLRAAEWRLRESLAQSDATRLSFYPNLSLTGSLGTSSSGLSNLLSNPLGSVAIALAAPFLQFNQAKFATALARTQYEEAAVNFRKTLLQALTDADNALSLRTRLTEENTHLTRSLEAAAVAEHLNEVRYRAGAITLQVWLDAQEARRQAETALVGNRLSRVQNFTALSQALGGGFGRSVMPIDSMN